MITQTRKVQGKGAKRLLLLALLWTGCDPVVVPVRETGELFDFRLVAGRDSLIMRWPNGSRIRVFLQPAADANHNSALQSALRHTIYTWEAAALYGDFRIQQVVAPEEADVILTLSGADLPVSTSSCPPGGAAAYTTFCLESSRDRLAVFPLRNGMPGSVRFLVTVRAAEAADAARLRALVAHEFGHVLGLAQHSPNVADLMYRDPARDLPNARDRTALQVLYATPPDIVP